MASWIEMLLICLLVYFLTVEAYVASWIEIRIVPIREHVTTVEAYVASWIEIIRYDDIFIISCRGLCGLVD